jgi:hypothetical protein
LRKATFFGRAERALAAAGLCLAVVTCSDATGPRSEAGSDANPISGLRLDADSVGFTVGDSVVIGLFGLQGNGRPASAADARWMSRDAAVVGLRRSGVLVGTGAGRAWVVAANGDHSDSVLAIVHGRAAFTVAPVQDTLDAIGGTLHATINGEAPDAAASWGVRDPSVAAVTQHGKIVARANGETYVVALGDGGGADSVHLVVRQKASGLAVTPAFADLPRLRSTRINAVVADARGHPLAVSGQTDFPLTWSASDSSRIAFDSTDAGVAVVRGTGEGVDTIRVSGGGLSGVALLRVTAAVPLRFDADTVTLAAGQRLSPTHAVHVIADSAGSSAVVALRLESADSSIATVDSAAVSGAPILPIAVQPGATELRASAHGYSDARLPIRVSTPRLSLDDHTLHVATGTRAALGLTAVDSLGVANRLQRVFTVAVQSSDTAVIAADSVRIEADKNAVSVAFTAVSSGSAMLRVTAPGFLPDSARIRVNDRPLNFQSAEFADGTLLPVKRLGTSESGETVIIAPGDPLPHTITLTRSGDAHVQLPDSVVVPGFAVFTPSAVSVGVHVSSGGPGVDTVIASGSGYAPDTLLIVVRERAFLFSPPTSMSGGQRRALDIGLSVGEGSTLSARPTDTVRALIRARDAGILELDRDTLTFDPEHPSTTVQVHALGAGTTILEVSPLQGDVLPFTSAPVQVTASRFRLSYQGAPNASSVSLGMHQELPADSLLVVAPFPPGLHVTSSDTGIVMPVEQNPATALFNLVGGDRAGTAWLVASAPGWVSDSIQVVVGQGVAQLVRLVPSLEGAPGALEAHVVDQNGSRRVTAEDVTFGLWSSNASIVTTDSTSLTVPAFASTSATTQLIPRGAGTAAVRGIDRRSSVPNYGTIASEFMTFGVLLAPPM